MTVVNKIYMVAPGGKLIWSYSPGVPLAAQPVFRADRSEIAIIGQVMFQRLDADTGKVLSQSSMNGSAEHTDVKKYGKGYLVLSDMTGYRNRFIASGGSKIPDRLDYWGEMEKDYWETDFPIGAQLTVAGEHIYGVKYEKNTATLEEILPPVRKQ